MSEEDALVREVNEAIRRQKWQGFIEHFGRYIIGVTVLTLLSTAGYLIWHNHQQSTHAANTLMLYKAMVAAEENERATALTGFETLSERGDTPSALLADMWRVKLAARSWPEGEAGKEDASSSMTAEELAERRRQAYRSRARYRPYLDWLELYAPVSVVQEGSAAPKARFADHTYRLTMLERVAVDHMRRGRLAEAAAVYDQIAKDSQTPRSMRRRARLLLATTLSDAGAAAASAAPEASAKLSP